MLTSASSQAVRSQITEAQKIAGGSGSEQDIAEAKIELEVRDPFTHTHGNRCSDSHAQVLESLQASLK